MKDTEINASARGVVRVTVPTTVFHNFDKMQSITKQVLGRLGCPACHSGFDIRFRQEIEFRVDLDEKLHG